MRIALLAAIVLASSPVLALDPAAPACAGNDGGSGRDASRAAPVAAGTSFEGCVTLLADREDTYVFMASAGERISATLTPLNCGTLEIAIGQAGEWIAWSFTDGCEPVAVGARAGATGPVELQVFHHLGVGAYRVDVEQGALSGVCGDAQDDAGSGGDSSYAVPAFVGPGTWTVCMDRFDPWDDLAGSVSAGDVVRASVPGCTRAYVGVIVTGGDVQSGGTNRAACEHAVAGARADEDGTFHVSLASRDEGPLTVVIEVSPSIPHACGDLDDFGAGRDTRPAAPGALVEGTSTGCVDGFDRRDGANFVAAKGEGLLVRLDAGCNEYLLSLTEGGGLVRDWHRTVGCQAAYVFFTPDSTRTMRVGVDRIVGEGPYTVTFERCTLAAAAAPNAAGACVDAP